ncbi:unnamed protein product, partial [Mesorhabditis spiculigera]
MARVKQGKPQAKQNQPTLKQTARKSIAGLPRNLATKKTTTKNAPASIKMFMRAKPAKPGVRALQEIRRLQKTTDFLIPKSAMFKVVKEIIHNHNHDLRLQSSALDVIRTAVESYITGLFEDAMLLAIHARRVTVFPKDMQLASDLEVMSSGEGVTAAELRERRKAKILANSEGRMARILSGPGGEEQRRAPAMEGGEPMACPDFQNINELADTFAPLASTSRPSTGERIEGPAGNTEKHSQLASFDPSTRRYELDMLLAVVLAFSMSILGPFNIIWLWLVAFGSFEYFLRSENAQIGEDQLLNIISLLPAASGQQHNIRRLARLGATMKSFYVNSSIFYVTFIVCFQFFRLLPGELDM